MSLAIDVDNVTNVLLADGWHGVANGSFDIDAYEFVIEDRPVHGGGESGISASGFVFDSTKTGRRVYGPLTSIIAVQTKREKLTSSDS